MSQVELPPFTKLMNPLIRALKDLGGSGTINEIDAKTAEAAGLSDEQLEVLHNAEKSSKTEVEYRLAWARTYLKRYGVLENSARGVWALTPKGTKTDRVNPTAVRRAVRQENRSRRAAALESAAEDEPDDTLEEPGWRDQLMRTLLGMDPSAFERLVQRLLREAGFIQVEVTGRTGDGGIDGKGIVRIGGLLGFQVIFQCKKYQGSVSASQVRDFRGAMVGRADKGLLVTTGSFTRDAVREATRDGAPAIDLIDGDLLLDKLKDLALGVRTQRVQIEQVTVDPDWFASI